MKRSAGFVTSYHYDSPMARIGIIGTGWGARSQVPNFREAGLEVVAIAGSHGDKTKRVAEEFITGAPGVKELNVVESCSAPLPSEL